MKKNAALFLLLFIGQYAYAQFDDLNHIDTFIYNKVYKNIAAYQIKHVLANAGDRPFSATDHFFYESVLPDADARMGMVIEKTDLVYPINTYDVYRITMNGMQFQNKDKIMMTLSGINPGHLFLVAVDKQSGGIKFISGQFFLSAISADFNLNRNDPSSFINYLFFKTYADELKNIQFGKRILNLCYYRAFSTALQKPVNLVLDTKNMEVVKMLGQKTE
ncbi:hypothetical protein [Mucilaginibacter paludis]|uniref:DUF4468 domain-containing protein n=1 Tax=Mucilaginibacter paludis DSM 18603 TaxID=714943 RepID=H1YAU4_9SPHI|nr:hypothetical protein [Mucilaginibacter paludis]EHQ29553.1 hypothetical protein Mucpa_5481 [Mucilaginibacter paludis DSM 18603]